MKSAMPCVVADTSPLFYLAQLELLPILRALYSEVHIPSAVWIEALAGGRTHPLLIPQFHSAIAAGWIVVSSDPPDLMLSALASLDAGERAAITLAKMLNAELLLVDERLGRSAAKQLGLKTAGTLGILAAAKYASLIPALKPLFHRLRTETNFRFSIRLENDLLAAAGESPDP